MEASSGTLGKVEGTRGLGEGAVGKDDVGLGTGSGLRLSKVSGKMGQNMNGCGLMTGMKP